MKKTNLIGILTLCLSLCFINISFAEIDLDLGDESPSSNASVKESWATLMGGYDLGGTGEIDVTVSNDFASASESEEGDIESGFSIYFELGKAINKNIGLGGGASYGLGRGIDEEGEEGEFNFIPVYGLLKIWFPTPSVVPFGIVHVGYNFFFADDDFKGDLDTGGGLYWAIGGGIMFDNGVQLELLYATHNGTLTGEDSSEGFTMDIDVELSYSKVTLAAGINF